MTIADRISSGEDTQQLREDIARALGWTATGRKGMNCMREEAWLWVRSNQTAYGLPDYMGDIRLTLAEIERMGLGIAPLLPVASTGCSCVVLKGPWTSFSATRPDRNLTLCAIEALMRALGE